MYILFVSVVQEPAVQLTLATGQKLSCISVPQQVFVSCLTISNGSFSECVHVKFVVYIQAYP